MAPEKFRHKVKDTVASIFRSRTPIRPADVPDPQPTPRTLEAQLDSGQYI
jgi:hypothetical protein